MNNIIINTSDDLSFGRCKISKNIHLPFHYHNQIEFVYVLDGIIDLAIGDKSQKLKRDEFAIIRSLDVHSFKTETTTSSVLLVILPDTFSIKFSDRIIHSKWFLKNSTNSNEIRKIAIMYDDFLKLGKDYFDIYYELIYCAIEKLYGTKNSENKYSKIIDYIKNNYTNELSLNRVCKECNTNRSYVSRAINATFGIGFNQYINRLRIALFLRFYLENNNSQTIEELALLVGFKDSRTFYRAYKKELNCTPSQYAKVTRNNLKELR